MWLEHAIFFLFLSYKCFFYTFWSSYECSLRPSLPTIQVSQLRKQDTQMIFQSNPLSNSASTSFIGTSVSSIEHFFDNGNPHSLKFQPHESFPNVSNWLPRGINLVRRFLKRFKTSRNVKLVNSWGILTRSLFEERSNDLSNFKFLKDDGICPVRLSWDKLNSRSELRFTIDFGISHWNLLREKSIVVKVVDIFTNSISNPFIVTIIKSW